MLERLHRNPRPAAKNPTELRVALVGVGRWGQRLMRVCCATPRVRLVAVCDRNPEALALVGSVLPGVRRFSGIDDLHEFECFDAIMLATPSGTHAALALKALSAGLHVFVEKPMATSLADALAVHARVQATSKQLMVGHVLEYHPNVTRLRAVIRFGTLGEVRFVCSERFGQALTSSMDAWWELAPHDFSLLRLITSQEIESVAARRCATHSVAAVAAFPSGASARIDVGRSNRGPKMRRTIVMGSQGLAIFDDIEKARLDVFPSQPGLSAWMKAYQARCALPLSCDARPQLSELAQFRHFSFSDDGEPLAIEIAHFAAAVLDSAELRSDADNGLRIVSALDAGERSMACGGRPVALPAPHLERRAGTLEAHGSGAEL